jgi:hypothetical protein
MPVKAKAVKFAVGDKVSVDIDGTDTECKVTKLKGENYIVADEDGTTYECEPHELKPLEEEEETSKKKKKPAAEEEEETPAPKKKKAAAEEGEETPKKKKGGLGWNATAPADEVKAFGLPVGQWEALAFNGVCEGGKGKSLLAYVEYVGVHDDEVTGKTQRAYYTIIDEKGQPSEGIAYFKRDLLTLGFTEEQLEIDEDEVEDELNKLLKKLRKMEPWVTINVKANSKTGQTNLYLNGIMDDQEDKPANPLSE